MVIRAVASIFIKKDSLLLDMRTKILTKTLIFLIIITIILFVALALVSLCEKKETKTFGYGGTGHMERFIAYHGEVSQVYNPCLKTTERYDDKYFEYLENMQEQRDRTFMKGRMFLIER